MRVIEEEDISVRVGEEEEEVGETLALELYGFVEAGGEEANADAVAMPAIFQVVAERS